ncbi:nitrate- and nitrite sensing domain-containing protein [Caenispirillum bisanense]|uniref:nitrate- and nitrite sensing domain-containing protein n=1 Tax=Caenispirillum bisanense TaxID=414052 RepID=UPI0031D83BCC
MNALLAWSEVFELGVDDLDRDHRQLVDFINEFHGMIGSKEAAARLLPRFDALVRHLEDHFQREEALLARLQGGEEARRHRDGHRRTLDHLKGLRDGLAHGDGAMEVETVVTFLHRWLMDHVLNHDQKMKPDLVKAGLVTQGGGGRGRFGRLAQAFNRLSLGARIVLVALLPTCALTVVAGLTAHDRYQQAQSLGRLDALADVADALSHLGHMIQAERGATAGYLQARTDDTTRQLAERRRLTDQSMAAATEGVRQGRALGLEAAMQAVEHEVQGLTVVREQVDRGAIRVPDALAAYTEASEAMLAATGALADAAPNAQLVKDLLAYDLFLEIKELAGLERATGNVAFIAGQIAPQEHQRFVSLIARQEELLKRFTEYASPNARALTAQAVTGDGDAALAALRALVIAYPESRHLGGVEGAEWFRVATVRIDRMAAAAGTLSDDLRETVSALEDDAQAAMIAFTAGEVVLLAVIALASVVLVRSITRPLASLRLSLGELAGGNTGIAIAGLDRRDEIGDIARSVATFKESIIRKQMDDAKAAIDLSVQKVKLARRDALLEEFRANIDTFLHSLTGSATTLQADAETMTRVADDARSRSSTVAAASTQASVSVETVAASSEELSASIGEINRQVAQAAAVAARAADSAGAARDTVATLEDRAHRIGEIIGLITDVANQTNLLALNATIEAARAGEAGKGFAVVANEVKALAGQTAKATEEISDQIKDIQSGVTDAVRAISEITRVVGEIDQITVAVSDGIRQQSDATREIARNVQQAALGTREVSSNVEALAEAGAQTGARAEQVREASRVLRSDSEQLRTQVEGFLGRMASL